MRNEKIYLELFANIGNYAYLGEQNVLMLGIRSEVTVVDSEP